MKNPVRILFLQNKLLHYRIPLYEYLQNQQGYEVCVGFPEGEITAGTNFRQIKLPVRHLKSFVLHQNLYALCCEYDVVIAMFDIRWLTHLKLVLKRKRPFKLIYWGIGVSTERGFDQSNRYDLIRYWFARLADAMVFYSDYSRKKYAATGISPTKLFVAPNTVATQLPARYWLEAQVQKKDCIIFIGSLHSRKNLEELLDSFEWLVDKYPFLRLHIIGEGAQRSTLEDSIRANSYENHVLLHGEITKDTILGPIFSRAVACVSPGQAGLSVLKSFSFGVPFITRANAITGGERFAIQDGHNGFLYPGIHTTLKECLLWLLENEDQSVKLRKAAFDFYWSHRTICHMAQGFREGIEFCTKLNHQR